MNNIVLLVLKGLDLLLQAPHPQEGNDINKMLSKAREGHMSSVIQK